VPPSVKQINKYKRIVASIAEVGIVEPLGVAPRQDDFGPYMLVDGHLRNAALIDLGYTTAPCLIADDDEAFTYNKRVNRLATVQEHCMIVKALERGVSEDAERPIDRLDCVQIASQDEADASDRRGRADVGNEQFHVALCPGSVGRDAARGSRSAQRPKKIRGLTPEQMARMEREMEGLQREFKAVETSYGHSVLNLVVASGYLAKLIGNPRMSRYLERHHPEILVEFKAIVATSSLDEVGAVAAQ